MQAFHRKIDLKVGGGPLVASLHAKDCNMDQEQRTAAAKRLDSERAARIVRNIEQIEADANSAIGDLSERLMGSALQAIRKLVTDPWQVDEVDLAARIVCPEWKMTRGVGTGDAWLELTEVRADEAEGFSWINVAVGAGPTRLGLELVFRRGLQEYAEAAIFDDTAVAPLLKQGMVRDETDSRLFFPIDIQAEALAQGFENNDLDKALVPVGQAMKRALAAKSELDQLIGQVRAAAARK